MQFSAHFGLERLIDDLVLLLARLPANRFGDHGRGIVVAISRQIADRHLRIRYPCANQPLDIASSHGHGVFTDVSAIWRRAENAK